MKISLDLDEEELEILLEHFKNHSEFDFCWCDLDKNIAKKLINSIEHEVKFK